MLQISHPIIYPVHLAISPQIITFFFNQYFSLKIKKSQTFLPLSSSPDINQASLLLLIKFSFPKNIVNWFSHDFKSNRLFTYGKVFTLRIEIII